jgi:ankyrin repeat protein
MNLSLINHFKKLIYLYALTGFCVSHAGSYEDFFKAVQLDDARTVEQLIARGFDVNTLDPTGQPGLTSALREPSPKVAGLLASAPKIDLNLLNAKGESPLMLASLKGQLDLAEQMIKKGADVNKTGWTPLHYAASTGQVAVIKLLIENNAYIDAESPNGSTPLMMASMYGTGEAVKLLLDDGADPGLKNQQGLTALQFAQRASRPDAIALLTKAFRANRTSPGKW